MIPHLPLLVLATLSSALPPSPPSHLKRCVIPLRDAQAYITTNDTLRNLSIFDPPVRDRDPPADMSTWDLSIDDTPAGHLQTLDGFGATLTDAAVEVLNKLPQEKLDALLRDLLTSEGLDIALMRHTIASSDLSRDPAYTYDDANGQPDPELRHFHLGDRGIAMLGLLKRMRALKPGLKIVGSSWSAPGWMKESGVLIGADQGNFLAYEWWCQFAQYFVKYLQWYRDEGVEVDAITIQNEPLHRTPGYPTMFIRPDVAGNLVRDYVGPALREAGFETEIWAYDHNTDRPDYPETVLSMAPEYVKATAWHCYADDKSWQPLTDFHAAHPNIPQYQTECYTSNTTSWSHTPDFLMGPLQNHAAGSMAWTLATDTEYGPHLTTGGCDICSGLVVIDPQSRTYHFTRDYYYMAHFSHFMPRGAVILKGTGSWTYEGEKGLESVASVNPDGSRTVVIKNGFGNEIYVTLKTASGERWGGRLERWSVVTWVLPPL